MFNRIGTSALLATVSVFLFSLLLGSPKQLMKSSSSTVKVSIIRTEVEVLLSSRMKVSNFEGVEVSLFAFEVNSIKTR